VVDNDYSGDDSSVSLSRKTETVQDPELPFMTIFGGKLTGCVSVAKSVAEKVGAIIEASATGSETGRLVRPAEAMTSFPGLADKVPSVEWCVERERCWTLEDYLRRRTNIAQWVPRGGFGRQSEHEAHLLSLATAIAGDAPGGAAQLAAYRSSIESVDTLLSTYEEEGPE
jgi:glycerol-3-phosphate dehydrogenase